MTTKCSFSGCTNPTRANGLCNGHYQQKYHGKSLTPLKEPGQKRPVVDGKKKCPTCNKTKSTGEFYIKDKKTGALSVDCKPCYSKKEADKQRKK
jgi:hypothetical protein